MPESFVLEITALAHDGRGIGFIPQPGKGRGLAVFVSRALPGQTIRCHIRQSAANYREGELLEVVASSFIPGKPHCPCQAQCGGCQLQPLPYYLQLEWKERLARDALLRIGKIEAAACAEIWGGIAASPQIKHYRNKITLAFGQDQNGKPALGFRKAASHAIVPFAGCALIDQSAQPIISAVSGLALASKLSFWGSSFKLRPRSLRKDMLPRNSGFWRFLTLRKQSANGWHALLVTSPGDKLQRKIVANLAEKLLADNAELVSVTHDERSQRDMLANGGRRVFGLTQAGKSDGFSLELGNRLFGLDVSSFFQANTEAGQILGRTVRKLDGVCKGRLLDLYCGVGAPGQLLADRHESCRGIEQDTLAVKWAARNAAQANLKNWNYAAGNVTNRLPALAVSAKKGEYQTVLLDPPRSGLGRGDAARIAELGPEHIIYVSCNPVTMARDCTAWGKYYRLAGFKCVDMFPHTPHVECCGIWERTTSI